LPVVRALRVARQSPSGGPSRCCDGGPRLRARASFSRRAWTETCCRPAHGAGGALSESQALALRAPRRPGTHSPTSMWPEPSTWRPRATAATKLLLQAIDSALRRDTITGWAASMRARRRTAALFTGIGICRRRGLTGSGRARSTMPRAVGATPIPDSLSPLATSAHAICGARTARHRALIADAPCPRWRRRVVVARSSLSAAAGPAASTKNQRKYRASGIADMKLTVNDSRSEKKGSSPTARRQLAAGCGARKPRPTRQRKIEPRHAAASSAISVSRRLIRGAPAPLGPPTAWARKTEGSVTVGATWSVKARLSVGLRCITVIYHLRKIPPSLCGEENGGVSKQYSGVPLGPGGPPPTDRLPERREGDETRATP